MKPACCVCLARGLACVVLVVALADAARAQTALAASPERSIVLVQAHACEPARYDADALFRLLELELAGLDLRAQRLPEAAPAAQAALATAVAVVAIDCAAVEDTLLLRVSDLATGKQLERELSLAGVGADARPRALALSAATLLETSLSELAISGAPAPARAHALPPSVRQSLRARMRQRLAPQASAVPPVPAPEADVEAARDAEADVAAAATVGARAALLFDASAALRAFPGRSTGLVGVRVGLAPALGPALRLAIDAEALYGRSDLSDAMGKIGVSNLFWLAGGVGLGWVVPGAPELELGPRVLAGYALADADVDRMGASANDESGFALSVLVSATLRFAASRDLDALLGADLGYTPVGIVFLGDQSRLSGMADATLGLRLGVSWN